MQEGMEIKMGKLIISHRYDRLPLLPSGPGGFGGSWSYKTYPAQRYVFLIILQLS